MSSLMMSGMRNTKLLFSLCFFYQFNCDRDTYLLWGSVSFAAKRCVARKKSMSSNMWRADHKASTTICPTLQKDQNGTSLLGKRLSATEVPSAIQWGIYPHVVLLRERLDKTTWCQNMLFTWSCHKRLASERLPSSWIKWLLLSPSSKNIAYQPEEHLTPTWDESKVQDSCLWGAVISSISHEGLQRHI